MAIMLAGSSVGYFVGLAPGGYIAATLGWRNAFLLAGALGVLLAAFTPLILAEPRLRLGFPSANSDAESSREALEQLRKKRSFVYKVMGISLFYFFNVGVTTFLFSLMTRNLHTSLEQISVTWGVVVALDNLFGTLAGGWMADRLGRRDIRWYAWMSTIACLVEAPLYWIALSSSQLWPLVSVEFVAEFVLWTGTFATRPTMHAICSNPRRGTAIAVATFAYVTRWMAAPGSYAVRGFITNRLWKSRAESARLIQCPWPMNFCLQILTLTPLLKSQWVTPGLECRSSSS
jgi:predicted MFS family arabinose efflux permease